MSDEVDWYEKCRQMEANLKKLKKIRIAGPEADAIVIEEQIKNFEDKSVEIFTDIENQSEQLTELINRQKQIHQRIKRKQDDIAKIQKLLSVDPILREIVQYEKLRARMTSPSQYVIKVDIEYPDINFEIENRKAQITYTPKFGIPKDAPSEFKRQKVISLDDLHKICRYFNEFGKAASI